MLYWQDVRYALRLLARQPGFTLLTVLVLAGGLGLSIFTFSFLYSAMLKPIPVREGERIVRVGAQAGSRVIPIQARDLNQMRGRVTRLSDIGVYSGQELVIGTGEGSRAIGATASEWNIFEVTGTRPLLGRGLRPDDQQPGAEPVVVLSYYAWRVLFARDSAVIGRTVAMNGTPTRVIGVMPDGYGFPVASEAWIPLDPTVLRPDAPLDALVQAYGRLAPGASTAGAASELTALLRQARAERPPVEGEQFAPTSFWVSTFPLAQIGEEAPLILVVLNLLAGLILLLACINVTNLLLARANERARESAVRLALGAPRARLIMQGLWESLLLCLAGGVLATGLAGWGLGSLDAWCRSHLEGNLAFWWAWGFDRTVLVAAGGFVTLATMVLGGVMARRAGKVEIAGILKDGGTSAGGRAAGRVARLLVITQVAVVTVLLFFGSMAGIIAYRVATLDLGYDSHGVLASGVDLPADRYPDGASRGRIFRLLQEQLSARPELSGVVFRSGLAGITDDEGAFEIAGGAPAPVHPRSYIYGILGSLEVIGSRVSEGRAFDSRDDRDAPPVAIVSAAFAARHFPPGRALGAQILLSGLAETAPRTIVGVTGDLLLGNPFSRERSAEAVYLPLRQSAAVGTTAMFRYRGSEGNGRNAFYRAIGEVDPRLVPAGVTSLDEVLSKSSMLARSVSLLFGGCFGFALLLALSGTYGLMARAIGRQTREIGVRRALGATDPMITRMLLSQGGRQLGIGALAALPLTLLVAWGFARHFPISIGLSALTAVLVSATITLLVLFATWVPARRAIAIEVRDALWRE
ncbi:MAG: ABC transporter permease [Gemmatimonadales bacterium]